MLRIGLNVHFRPFSVNTPIDRVNAAIQEVATHEAIAMPNPIYTLENQVKLSDEDVKRIASALKVLV
jgi:hypothetical protein